MVLEAADSVDRYRASFEYCINGERIGTSLYLQGIVLARHKQLTFEWAVMHTAGLNKTGKTTRKDARRKRLKRFWQRQ